MQELSIYLSENTENFGFLTTAKTILDKYNENYPLENLSSNWTSDVFPELVNLNELQGTNFDNATLNLLGSVLFNNKGQITSLKLLGRLFNMIFNKMVYTDRGTLELSISVLTGVDLEKLKVILNSLIYKLLMLGDYKLIIDLYAVSLTISQEFNLNTSVLMSRLIETEEYY